MSILTPQHQHIARTPSSTHTAHADAAPLWEHPRAPRIEAVAERVRVEFAGTCMADTARALRVVRPHAAPVYYIPRADVAVEYLVPVTTRPTFGPFMPVQWWHVIVDAAVETMAAWSFPEPLPAFEALRDAVSFDAAKVDGCYVGDYPAVPAGRRRGGWLTIDGQLLATLQACAAVDHCHCDRRN